MRRAFALLVVSTLIVSCGSPAGDETTSDTPEIMAVALVQLVTVDNTFGGGPPPFTEYLIQTKTDPFAGDVGDSTPNPTRDLTEDERAAIEEAISGIGPVRWIDDPEEWRTPELTPVVDGSVILGLGEPVIEGDTALVPVSLWCGGLCGTWFSYRIDRVDGSWAVTGIEGPVAIS
ncbi:MAG: hypothetical protein WCE80_05960 [Acidimicrobiia bacterium]